jgi:large subunit ribosomal protein L24
VAKLHIHKGDKVQIIAGKDKGKVATVLYAYPESQRVVVEKANIVKKHMRPTQKNTQGGIMEIEAPLHVSNVMLMCPKCGKPVRVGIKRDEEGKKLRYCKKCNAEIK